MHKSFLRILDETRKILADSDDFPSDVSRLLEAIGSSLDFRIGEFWLYDESSDLLTLSEPAWVADEGMRHLASEFRGFTLRPGQGMAGTVAELRSAVRVEGLRLAARCPRYDRLKAFGLTAGAAFPILDRSSLIGVMVFFGIPSPIPDEDLRLLLNSLASQIGEFVRRARAENLAIAREALLRDVLDNLPVGVFIKDRGGVYRMANRAILADHDLRAEDVIGRTDWEIFPPSVAMEISQADRDVLETDQVSEREIRIDLTQRSRHVLVRKVRLHGHEDAGYEICGAVTNVSALKQAEDELRLSEQRYRKVVDEQSELISRFRPDGTLTFVNSAYRAFFGRTEEELVGNVWQPQAHPDDYEMIVMSLAGMNANRPTVTITNRVFDGKGVLHWMEFVNQGFFDADGSLIEIQSVGRDVTDRMELELALARSEIRMRQAMEAAQEAVWECDLVTNHLTANLLWYRQLGYEPGEVPVAIETWDRAIHPDDQHVLRKFRESLSTPTEDFASEYRIITKKGDIRWVRTVSKVVERDAAGMALRIVGTNLDITDRKEAEAALYQSEQRLRHAMEASQEAVWDWNMVTGEVIANDLWYEQFGYVPGQVESNVSLCQDGSHPEDRERVQAALRDHMEGRTPKYLNEHRIVVANTGEVRWHRSSGLVVERDADGRPIRMVGTNLDITDRMRMETALADSESRHRMALQAAQEAIWEWNIETGEGRANDLWFELFGLPDSTMPVNFELWNSHLHPEDRERTVRCLLDYVFGISSEYLIEYRIVTGAGEVRWHRSTGVVMTRNAIGQPTRIVGTSMDITDRKRSEIKLKSALERLRMATEAGHIAVWAWNFADDSLEWDDRMYEIYGHKPSDFPNGVNYDVWYDRVHPEDKQKAVDELLASKLRNDPLFREFRIVRPDGTVRHIQSASVVDFDPDGRPLQMIGINRDITEQRDFERDLREAKVAAEAANLAKSNFLATMSHEVRTPLTAVLGYADMLSDPEIRPEEVSDAITSIRRNGAHLLTILDDILDLSKIEAGKMPIESIAASPWQIAVDAGTLLKIRAGDKQVELKVTPATDLPVECLLDPTRVRQVLVNLLSNSVKFTEPGGAIEMRVGAISDFLFFEVEDSGIGMSAEQLTQVFDPFSQADASTTRRFGGTGLGLTITSRLVHAMNGSVSVRSEPGKGSQFTVRLPLKWPAQPPEPLWNTPGESSVIALNRQGSNMGIDQRSFEGRILLADDSEDNRRVILFLLKKLGLRADVAINGLEAVTAATKAPYDLILMDMQMPIMDGYVATRTLRDAGFDRPIVALTASTMSHDRKKAIDSGCSDFLSKPLEPRHFQSVLSKFLGVVSVR